MTIRKTKNLILVIITSFVMMGGLASSAFSTILKADIGVNGLACPFCAYGLEKKLEALGVKSLEIKMDEGKALVEFSNQSVSVKKIEKAVKNAGFSTRYLRLTVLGMLELVDGDDMLRGKNTDVLYRLENNSKLKELKSVIDGKEIIIKVGGDFKKVFSKTAEYKIDVKNFDIQVQR